jgi:hypothetical protein
MGRQMSSWRSSEARQSMREQSSKRLVEKLHTKAEHKMQRKMDASTVEIERELKKKSKELKWRSRPEYYCRQATAWTFAFVVIAICLLVAIVFAAKFGEADTGKMCISWLIAYGLTFAIIEPLQVILLAGAPFLFDESHRCGRCMTNCRTVYNELCAP